MLVVFASFSSMLIGWKKVPPFSLMIASSQLPKIFLAVCIKFSSTHSISSSVCPLRRKCASVARLMNNCVWVRWSLATAANSFLFFRQCRSGLPLKQPDFEIEFL